MADAARRIGVAVDVHERLIELAQHDRDRIKRRIELAFHLILIRIEGDARRHVQDDLVAITGYGNARALQLRAELVFLAIHVIADCTTTERTDTGADQHGIALRTARTADHQAAESTHSRADRSTTGSVRHLLFPGIRISGAACEKCGGEKGNTGLFQHEMVILD